MTTTPSTDAIAAVEGEIRDLVESFIADTRADAPGDGGEGEDALDSFSILEVLLAIEDRYDVVLLEELDVEPLPTDSFASFATALAGRVVAQRDTSP